MGRLVKTVALLTGNARKAEEWYNFLRHHGLTAVQVAPEADPEELLRQGHQLVCREQSLLVEPGTDRLAQPLHLAPVEHLCRIECWPEGRLEARRAGYVDLSLPAEPGGWWDTQFRDALTGRTYADQAMARGTKLSARAAALEQLVERYFTSLRQARHMEVDLDGRVSALLDRNPCIQRIQDTPARGLLNAAVNRGLFLNAGRTRPQQVYFWPGLSGLPSVPRESAVDEAKFLFHDLVHFLIGRLVPTGPMTEPERQIFLAWAMVEEGLALMLADGVFVDLLHQAGVEYDFDQHKGYPFYKALGLQGKRLERQELRELLWANVSFFALGDRSLFRVDPEDERARRYLDGFDRFSMGDWLWNQRMALHARADADFYRAWWELAEPLNRDAGLEVLTPAQIPYREDVVRAVFDFIWEHRLDAWGQDVPRISPEEESWRASRRWLLGQLGFFAAFRHVPAVARAGELLSRLPREVPPDRLKRFVHQAMEACRQLGECSASQAARWGEFFPLFPPYYIGYKARPGLTPARLAERILGPEGGRKQLEDELPGVAAVVCNPERDRFRVEQRDGMLALPGGRRLSPDETAEVAWRRLSDLPATRWQRMRLPHEGRELDVLLVETAPEAGWSSRQEVERWLEQGRFAPGHDLVLATFLRAR